MKVQKVQLVNFGSYESLDFDFQDLGLTLVHGDTGSGKSTLLDAPCWVLYGRTAKGGNVDEIKSWHHADKATTGILTITTPNGTINVTRIRGARSHENDLFWTDDSGEIKRGKDITETQLLINEHLGCDYDSYLASSYFCEYSPSASFFVSNAKQQRELFEILSPLKFPETIAQVTSNERKSVKKLLLEKELEIAKRRGRAEQLEIGKTTATHRINNWEITKGHALKELADKARNFETEKQNRIDKATAKFKEWDEEHVLKIKYTEADIRKLEETIQVADYKICSTCGNAKGPLEEHKARLDYLKKIADRLYSESNPHLNAIMAAQELQNYAVDDISKKSNEINPYLSQLDAFFSDIAEATKEIELLINQKEKLENKILALTQLYDMSFTLRGMLLNRTLADIESGINGYIRIYFDSEFTVSFKMEGSDKLTTSIVKNGIPCIYRQLSKGQRSLLKLAFAAAVMKTSSNNSGVHFDNLFFDEALDGLDESLKLKAYNLLESVSLNHSSVLVIDHSEALKSMFNKRFHVTLHSDISNILEDVT